MNYGWCEIIECSTHFYQSNLNVPKILAQLSGYNDILNKYIQAKRITGSDKCLGSSNMRATTKACQPEDITSIINALEENEEDTQRVVKNNKRDEHEKPATKENEEGWIKSMKFIPIAHFLKKITKASK